MTLTLPDADIRAFYSSLAVEIPAWAQQNASVRCFADPDAHNHQDRSPSASISLTSGAFQCHACGARGGPYDAALTQGHTPRSAIDLMADHGLIEHRARLLTANELTGRRTAPQARTVAGRRPLRVDEDDIARYAAALQSRPNLISRFERERAWNYRTMRELDLGYDRGRITIPIRNGKRQLRGLLRYRTDETSQPKMLASPGTRLGLIPHPNTDDSPHLLLVEGPADMIAARSRGISAIAVPGDHAWRDEWGPLLAGRHITIVMDADDAGRTAACQINESLATVAHARIVDLAPNRRDGFDLTDWILLGPDDLERNP